MKKLKKILAFNLAFSLCFGYLPTVAYAEEGQGHMECEHHQVHTAECGYSEGIEGSPCNHKCTLESGCVINANTEENNTKEEGEVSDNSTQDNSIQLEVVCTHTEHDENCGYLEAVEGSECTYFCGVCQIQNLINQLPDEVNENNQAEVEKMLSEIDNLKSGLTDQETLLVDDTKYKFIIVKIKDFKNQSNLIGEGTEILDTKTTLREAKSNVLKTGISKEVVYVTSSTSSVGIGTADSPYNSFPQALSEVKEGGKIVIVNHADITANDGIIQNSSEQIPYIIGKNITIEGNTSEATLSVYPAGLILNSNVTFRNIRIGLANKEKSAIFANGHQLTLENCGGTTNTRTVHLFGGGVADSNAMAGNHAEITVNDCSYPFGNLYAGAMDNSCNHPVTINILNVEGSELPNIYASGAQKGIYNDNDWFSGNDAAPPIANSSTYPVNGQVTINLDKSGIRQIYGQANDSTKADVSIITQNQSSTLNLTDINKLIIRDGYVTPQSILDGNGNQLSIDVEISSTGILDLSKVAAAEYNSYIIKNISGEPGAKLRVNRKDEISVIGNLSGTFELQTTDAIPTDGSTSGRVEANHSYLVVNGANSGTVSFNPHELDKNKIVLVKDNDTWKTQSTDITQTLPKISKLLLQGESDLNGNKSHFTNDLSFDYYFDLETTDDVTAYFQDYPIKYEVSFGSQIYRKTSSSDGDGNVAKIPELNMKFVQVTDVSDDGGLIGIIYVMGIEQKQEGEFRNEKKHNRSISSIVSGGSFRTYDHVCCY